MEYHLKSSILIKIFFIVVLLLSISRPINAQCFGTADCNGDGLTLTMNDMVYLIDFIYNCGPIPPDLFACDLNGDCVVDSNDAHVFEEYILIGLPAFDPYGGYPVPTCCEPIVIRADIIANLFGMQHISRGSACLEAIDDTLFISDLDLTPGIPGNGFDAQPVMMPWFKGWNCRFAEDPTIPQGASILTDFKGTVMTIPDEFVASMRQDKRPDGKWDIWIQALPGVYQIDGYLNGTAIRQDRGSWTTNNTAWVNIGTLGSKSKGPNNGPYDMSIANIDDAGKIDICFGTEDSALWTWESFGIIDQMVTTVSFRNIDTDRVWIETITGFSQFGENMSTYGIVNENYTFNYQEFNVTNIGSAVIDHIAGDLNITNQSNISPFGLAAWPNPMIPDNYDYIRFVIEEDPLFPVGETIMSAAVDESFPAESFFDIFAVADEPMPTQPDFPAESFFDVFFKMTQTKTPTDEWDLAINSIVPATYIVEAGLGETVLFTSPPIPATGLPVDIGSVTFNPFSPNAGPHHQSISNFDDIGVIILEQPDSLYYNWPAQSVVGLKIDNIKVTFIHNILNSNLIPAITATDTTAFTLNDIEGVRLTCCNHDGIRGDANLDNNILVDDLVLLVNFLFKGGPPPNCYEEGDANGSGIILVDDLTLLVDYLFKSGLPPVACP